jgi:hypothetical protein
MSSLFASSLVDFSRPWSLVSLLLRIPLAAFFLWLAYKNLGGDAKVVADFHRWGYSPPFLMAVGVAQGIGGLSLLLPQTCFAGAMLLCGVLLGAIYTHVRFDPLVTALTPAAFLVAVAAVAALHRPQGWL